MAKPFRPKRGTTAKNDAFVGLQYEITLDKDKSSLRVHDGLTAGGVAEILPKAQNDLLYAPKNGVVTSVNNQTGDVTIDTSVLVNKSGNRGQLAGYETSGTATTINANSPDSNQVGTNVTVANGSANTAWTKVVRLTAAVTVTLGSAWQWAGGEVPETSVGGVIVLCWCGDGGVANFVSVSA